MSTKIAIPHVYVSERVLRPNACNQLGGRCAAMSAALGAKTFQEISDVPVASSIIERGISVAISQVKIKPRHIVNFCPFCGKSVVRWKKL